MKQQDFKVWFKAYVKEYEQYAKTRISKVHSGEVKKFKDAFYAGYAAKEAEMEKVKNESTG